MKDKAYYDSFIDYNNRILYTIEDTFLKGLYKEDKEADFILHASDNEPTNYKEAIGSSEAKE